MSQHDKKEKKSSKRANEMLFTSIRPSHDVTHICSTLAVVTIRVGGIAILNKLS